MTYCRSPFEITEDHLLMILEEPTHNVSFFGQRYRDERIAVFKERAETMIDRQEYTSEWLQDAQALTLSFACYLHQRAKRG